MESADWAGRIDTVERRMDSMELRWDESFAALSTQILQSNRETREAILATLRGEVAGEFSAVRTEFTGEFSAARAEMGSEFSNVRAEIASEFSKVRTEFASEFSNVRAEMAGEFSAVRAEMAGGFSAVRAEVAGEFSTMRAYFETVLADSQEETRRYMRVLYEDILSRIALLGEGRPSSS